MSKQNLSRLLPIDIRAMGSASSKAAKTAAGAAKRQYPTRIPPNTAPSPATAPPKGSTLHPEPHASSVRDESKLSQFLVQPRNY